MPQITILFSTRQAGSALRNMRPSESEKKRNQRTKLHENEQGHCMEADLWTRRVLRREDENRHADVRLLQNRVRVAILRNGTAKSKHSSNVGQTGLQDMKRFRNH